MFIDTLTKSFANFAKSFHSRENVDEKPQFSFDSRGVDSNIWKITFGTPTNYITVSDHGYTIEVIDGHTTIGTSENTADNTRIKKTMLEALGEHKIPVPPNFKFLYNFIEQDPALKNVLKQILPQ